MTTLHAGFARRDITQPLGSPALYGPAALVAGSWDPLPASRPVGQAYAGQAVVTEIWDPLYATALYLDDGQQRAVIIGADMAGFLEQPHRDIRMAVGKALGMPAESVVLNPSHSHSAPYVSTELQELMTPHGLRTIDLEYAQRMKDLIVAAAQEAARRAQPARVRSGRARVERVASNRRVKRPDGVTIHRYGRPPEDMKALPEGLIDPDVRVVRFDDAGGTALGALVNYACHPTAAGGDVHPWVSADFAGCGLRLAEAALNGAPCVFLQGAAGDIGTGKWIAGTCREDVEAMGRRFASGILGALNALVPVHGNGLRLGHRRVPLAFEPFSPLAEIKERMEEHIKARNPRCVADADALIVARRVNEFRQAPVSAIVIGDLAIALLPGEVFVELGLAIQANSPFRATLVSAYNDVSLQYIPTRSAFPEGEYEVNGGWRYTAPGDGEVLAEGAMGLLTQLKA